MMSDWAHIFRATLLPLLFKTFVNETFYLIRLGM